jgi:hypothetical protein
MQSLCYAAGAHDHFSKKRSKKKSGLVDAVRMERPAALSVGPPPLFMAWWGLCIHRKKDKYLYFLSLKTCSDALAFLMRQSRKK